MLLQITRLTESHVSPLVGRYGFIVIRAYPVVFEATPFRFPETQRKDKQSLTMLASKGKGL